MPDIKIKASMEWKCPYCGLTAKGTLNMNGAAMTWLDKAWEEHLKTCRDASKPAELVEGAILTAPADCPCGKAPLPWHLVAIADNRFSHVCNCRNGYAWASETTMRYQGKCKNPIADFDEAQARKNKTPAHAGG